MRVLVAISFALLAFAGAAAWVVDAEPDWYLRTRYPLEYEHVIRAYAHERDLDPALVAAVIYAESRFDPNVRSSAGAVGLMQILPETGEFIARSTGGSDFIEADLRDPDINVRYGTWLLDYLRDRYDGDVATALAAYHAGPGNVDEWRRQRERDRVPGDAGVCRRGGARREGLPPRVRPRARRRASVFGVTGSEHDGFAGDADQLTLGLLLESLGEDVVRVVATPNGVDVPVGGIVIYDATERSAISPGAVLLAVGVRPDTPESATLMDAVVRAGAAAVVFKGWNEVAALSREPASRRVALLSVPEEMTWTQLHAFLVNASRFSAESSSAGGIAGVPLGDLFALSNAVAGAVGGAVTIEDPARRVLAYSTIGEQPIDAARRGSILGRQVPDSPGIRTLYRMVFATDGVMTVDTPKLREILGGGPIDDHDLKPRSAVAVRAGSQAIGSIWIVHDESELDADSERSLLEAARIAAPHVIQARAARDVERRMRGEMLLAVLDGRGSADETATRLGFLQPSRCPSSRSSSRAATRPSTSSSASASSIS